MRMLPRLLCMHRELHATMSSRFLASSVVLTSSFEQSQLIVWQRHALCVSLGVDLVLWLCQCVRVPDTAVDLSILVCAAAFSRPSGVLGASPAPVCLQGRQRESTIMRLCRRLELAMSRVYG
jgi:hypothetical protein